MQQNQTSLISLARRGASRADLDEWLATKAYASPEPATNGTAAAFTPAPFEPLPSVARSGHDTLCRCDRPLVQLTWLDYELPLVWWCVRCGRDTGQRPPDSAAELRRLVEPDAHIVYFNRHGAS